MNQPARMPDDWRIVRPPTPDSESSDSKPKPKPKRRRTLRRAFKLKLKPRMVAEGAKKASFSPYLTALKSWETYWQQRYAKRQEKRSESEGDGASVPMTDSQKTQVKTKVYDPPVDRITKAHLEQFRLWLMPGRATITVNNYLRSISTLLASAETWLESKRQPKVRRLKERKSARKIIMSTEDVGAIYRSCDQVKWPSLDRDGQPVDPAVQWRAAVSLFFCFGFRTQEVLCYQSWKRSLSWENIHWQSESPGLSNAVNVHGWLSYVPEKQEGAKPEPLVLALPEIVSLHLRSLWSTSATPRSGTIFNWPFNERSLRSAWKGICLASGARPKFGSGATSYAIKHFRKTATTMHNLNKRGIAPYIIGHADRQSVSDMHYNNPELETTLALKSFPFPPEFEAIRKTDQLTLF